MRRALSLALCVVSLNSTACNSRAAREALVEATAATILAVGAAAIEAAADEQAERDAQEAERRSRRVTNQPGAWRLVREYDPHDQDDETNQQEDSSASRSSADPPTEGTTPPMPVISIGRCMVCGSSTNVSND